MKTAGESRRRRPSHFMRTPREDGSPPGQTRSMSPDLPRHLQHHDAAHGAPSSCSSHMALRFVLRAGFSPARDASRLAFAPPPQRIVCVTLIAQGPPVQWPGEDYAALFASRSSRCASGSTTSCCRTSALRVAAAVGRIASCSGREPVHTARAVRLRLALEALGPIFVKFRPDAVDRAATLLPTDMADELAKLQGSRAAVFRPKVVMTTLARCYRRPVDESLRELRARADRERVGGASAFRYAARTARRWR